MRPVGEGLCLLEGSFTIRLSLIVNILHGGQ